MRGKNPDLHGNVPDTCAAALLIIDMISDLDFPGGSELREHALAAAGRIAALKARAHEAGVPVLYVNDNFGRWRSDFRQLVAHALDDTPGTAIARRLAPGPEDYFVLKPKHSGFYATPLELLLSYLGARTLILTGVCTEACVYFTAEEAYVREFGLVVPPDGVASFCQGDHEAAIGMMGRLMKAKLTPTGAIDLAALKHEAASRAEA
jgi:nicotinamidase-related amidase